MDETVENYKNLISVWGVKGKIDKDSVTKAEAHITTTLDELRVQLNNIGIQFDDISPDPINAAVYNNPDYTRRSKALRKTKEAWKAIMTDKTKPWARRARRG